MTYRLKIIYTLTLILGFNALNIVHAAESSVAFWIAQDGDDTATGDRQHPFATLERARDAVRNLKINQAFPKKGVTVWIRGGVYERDQTFALDHRDSGLPSAPVIYSAAPGETVQIIGGRKVSASIFHQATDESFLKRVITPSARRLILQANLKEAGIIDYGELTPIDAIDFGSPNQYAIAPLEMSVDGEPMTLARWPNSIAENPIRGTLDRVAMVIEHDDAGKPLNYQKINVKNADHNKADGKERGQELIVGWHRLSQWQSDDIWVCGGLVRDYAYGQRKITSIDQKTGEVELATPVYLWPTYNQKVAHPIFFQNVPEELDAPGEYYLDRKTGVLSFIPPPQWNKNSQIILSMLHDVVVALEGSSHIRLRGLTIESSRSGGVFIAQGDDNIVENCIIRNVGTVGVQIGMGWESDSPHINPWRPEMDPRNSNGHLLARQPGSMRRMLSTGINNAGTALDLEGGKSNGVVESRIYNTGAGGVILGGGDRKTLTPAGNFVKRSEIFRTDRRIQRYAEAILIAGVGNLVQANYLHDAKGGLLYIHGNDHIIEYNEIAHAVSESTDCGAIEMRQNPSQLGNVIRYNYIHSNGRRDAQCYAIYLDNETCGTTIFGNIFADNRGRTIDAYTRSTISINGGFTHTISNNIFVDNDGGRLNDGRLKTFDVFRGRKFMLEGDVNVTRPPYSTRYPDFLKLYNEGSAGKPHNNIFNNVLVACSPFSDEPAFPEENFWHNNYQTDKNPGFVDDAKGNYALRSDAIIYKEIPGFLPVPFSKMQQANAFRHYSYQIDDQDSEHQTAK